MMIINHLLIFTMPRFFNGVLLFKFFSHLENILSSQFVNKENKKESSLK